MKRQPKTVEPLAPETMEQVHRVGQELLDEFARICEENDLRYYLIAGTLLGAVRHKGPIPWDDDADVCMPREDAEKFKEIMLSRPEGEKFHIYCAEDDPHYPSFIFRLMERGTSYISQGILDLNLQCREIWLDIFPLDDSPGPEGITYRMHGEMIAALKRIIINKCVNNLVSFQRIRGKVLHLILRPVPIRWLRTCTEGLMKKWNGKGCGFYVSWSSHYHFMKQTMPKSWYEPATTVLYSGKLYRAPGQWDKVLTQLYGDYMKPPTESNRAGHGGFEVKVSTENE